jgi:hypothetical protein
MADSRCLPVGFPGLSAVVAGERHRRCGGRPWDGGGKKKETGAGSRSALHGWLELEHVSFI